MLRSAELSKPDAEISLVFSEPDVSLQALLKNVEAEMIRPVSEGKSRHIYVELPPALLHEDFELDEWLHTQPQWHTSFAGLVSEEAHLLNPYYREVYEEFARSSQSVVILARSKERREEMPAWVDKNLLDFGRTVSVYEDDLWPSAFLHASLEGVQHRSLATLTEFQEEYEELEMPLGLQDPKKLEVLFRQMLQGDFGTLWGAEVIRSIGPESENSVEVVGLTLLPHAIFEWRAKANARCLGLSQQISLFNVVGVGLEKNNLIQSLRALQLLVDS